MSAPSKAIESDGASEDRAVVVVRYGEIFLKRGNRRHFEDLLGRNLRAAVGTRGEVHREHGRFLIRGVAAPDETARRAASVFGVTSASPAVAMPLEVERIVAAVVEEARVRKDGGADAGARRTFAVRTRRANKRFPMDSLALNRVAGRAVEDATALTVDLDAPDIEIGVEIGYERAYVFSATRPGPGGLPVGSAGQVALLLSGGIDSPVAGWLAQKRGCRLTGVYFHSAPHVGERAKEKVRDLTAILATGQGGMDLHVVPFAAAQEAVRDACRPTMYVVLYRRLMVRIAERIARRTGALALVTGESLAQVASQTLHNLGTIDHAATLPILRPLVTFDKNEAVALARRIGTYEISVLPHDDCCSLFVPAHPELKATPEAAERAERMLDVESLVSAAVAGVEVVRF